MTNKVLSSIILVLILIYGLFKNYALRIYSEMLNFLFTNIGIDGNSITVWMNNISRKKDRLDYVLGWAIYYPSYFLLHILFVLMLFKHQKKARNYLILGLTFLIFSLVFMSILGKVFDTEILYKFAYNSFQRLFGLPFILLFIEGGRILYKDVMKVD
ncbi:MAG: hypothetical protein JXR03_11655 [Cyclobacteriaceae bacterium]